MDPAYNPPPAGQQQPGYPPSTTQPPSSMQEEGGGTYNDAPHDPLRYQQPSSSNFMHQQNHDGVGGVETSGNALNALTAAAVAATPAPTVPNTMPTNMKISSPQGKIVESGMEHTGRWTKEEHEAFMAALQLYGKEWKKVAAKVKTRTIVQTRTHAQKYFQKLQKVLEVSVFYIYCSVCCYIGTGRGDLVLTPLISNGYYYDCICNTMLYHTCCVVRN